MSGVSFTVRDLPESVHAALKREAERQDRSLNKIVVLALTDAAESMTERAAHLARHGREDAKRKAWDRMKTKKPVAATRRMKESDRIAARDTRCPICLRLLKGRKAATDDLVNLPSHRDSTFRGDWCTGSGLTVKRAAKSGGR